MRPGKEAKLMGYTGDRVRGLEGRVVVWRALGTALLGPKFFVGTMVSSRFTDPKCKRSAEEGNPGGTRIFGGRS